MESNVRKTLIALGFLAAGGIAGAVALAQEQPAAAPAPPPNPCLNKVEADCGAVTGCVWLPGYKVASGAEVAGYCRPAPKPLTARRAPVAEQPR